MPSHCAALIAGLLACVAASAAPAVRTNDVEYARVADEALLLDLYRPEGASGEPLIVWVHGGAWERGTKAQMPLTALVERGFAIASVEFRPASRARFPGQIHDLKAAVRFLRASAARFGYDASRIAVMGASSGAHLAALVGTTNGDRALEGTTGDHTDVSSAVHAIVAYFPATNLTTILAQSTPFGLNIRTPAVQALLGAAPDADVEVARRASPVFHVDAADPPLLLLHGDQDPQMPINQSHELEGAYGAANVPAELIVVHGAAHGGDAFFDAARVALVAQFLERHLQPQVSAAESRQSATSTR
jgi:acetyl esterase/lipase